MSALQSQLVPERWSQHMPHPCAPALICQPQKWGHKSFKDTPLWLLWKHWSPMHMWMATVGQSWTSFSAAFPEFDAREREWVHGVCLWSASQTCCVCGVDRPWWHMSQGLNHFSILLTSMHEVTHLVFSGVLMKETWTSENLFASCEIFHISETHLCMLAASLPRWLQHSQFSFSSAVLSLSQTICKCNSSCSVRKHFHS